jgi:hypothetical protein
VRPFFDLNFSTHPNKDRNFFLPVQKQVRNPERPVVDYHRLMAVASKRTLRNFGEMKKTMECLQRATTTLMEKRQRAQLKESIIWIHNV